MIVAKVRYKQLRDNTVKTSMHHVQSKSAPVVLGQAHHSVYTNLDQTGLFLDYKLMSEVFHFDFLKVNVHGSYCCT